MASDLTVGADWVREQMQRGNPVFLVEVRHAGDQDLAVLKARGALRLIDHEAKDHLDEIPKERAVVVYSTAPNDEPAVELARLLSNNGCGDAHALCGGFKAYLSAGLPVEHIGEGRSMPRSRGM